MNLSALVKCLLAMDGEIFRYTNASGKVVGSIWHFVRDYYLSEKTNLVVCENASAHTVAGILGHITKNHSNKM